MSIKDNYIVIEDNKDNKFILRQLWRDKCLDKYQCSIILNEQLISESSQKLLVSNSIEKHLIMLSDKKILERER